MIKELKGYHVLGITVLFFAVIITVNFYMAFQAIATFPGVESKNTYYASQDFDVQRRAQRELGWTLDHGLENNAIVLSFTDAQDRPVTDIEDIKVLVGRATIAAHDFTPIFTRSGDSYIAPVDLDPGKWLLRIEARAQDGTIFRQTRNIYVK